MDGFPSHTGSVGFPDGGGGGGGGGAAFGRDQSMIQLSYGTLANRLSMNDFIVTNSFFLMCGFISLSSSCELELMNRFSAASAVPEDKTQRLVRFKRSRHTRQYS